MPFPDFDGVRALVTGGAGFIGSHLVDSLIARGASVRVLDNLSTGKLENLRDSRAEIDFVHGDIRDFDTCRRAARECRLIFHQAALGSVSRSIEDPAESFGINSLGTVNVLSAAREAKTRRIVFASSSSVYGDSERLPKREGEEGRPLSPYAASKRIDEEVARVFFSCYEMQVVGLRYFNVYGARQDPEGQYAAVIPRFFKAALRDRPMIIYGDGRQSRDFTHVSDAVAANLLAIGAKDEVSGQVFNVAAGERTTVIELARSIRDLCGGNAEPVHEQPRSGDVRHSLADLALASSTLGYRPQTSLQQGLVASVGYYRELFGAPPRS